MNSPWISGSQGEQYTVPGLPALLEAANARRTQAINDLGSFVGELAAGVTGAVQGAKNPQTFGEGTSTGFAALKGGLMNFNKAATGTGPSFAQFAALGKTADSLRDAVKTQTPSTPDQQPRVMGYTDDEWKHIGTDRKIAALQGFQQSLTAKQQMQAYDLGQMHMKAALDQQAAAHADAAAWSRFGKQYQDATQPGLNTGNDGFSMFKNLAGGNATTQPAELDGRAMTDLAIRSGVNPLEAAQLGANVTKAQAVRQTAQPQAWKNPETGRNYTLFGNTILPSKSDEELQAEAQAKANAVSANQRLSIIARSLATLYATPNFQTKPDVMQRIKELETEQRALMSGGGTPAPGAGAGAAAGANNNFGTLEDFQKWRQGL